MIFVFAGLLLIVSATIFKKTRDLGSDETHAASGIEFIGTLGLGIFMLLVGLIGLAGGIYGFKFDLTEASALFALALSANIQARLLNYASLSQENAKRLSTEKGNGINVLKTAFSVGLFPKKGSAVFFIHACQIVQLGAIALLAAT